MLFPAARDTSSGSLRSPPSPQGEGFLCPAASPSPPRLPLFLKGSWRAAPEGIKVSVSPRIFTLAISLAVWYAALRSVAEEFRLRFSPYELMMSPASLLSQRPLDAPVTLCYSILQRSFPPLSASLRIGRARKCGEASFFMLFPCRNDSSARRVFLPAKAPLVSQGELSATRMTEGIKPPVFHRTFFPALAVPSTALPGRNQRETAHGFSLSLRVRVHRERGSRNTLSLCASLVTFSASRKSPRGATGSRLPQKSCPERHPAVSPRRLPLFLKGSCRRRRLRG